MRWRSLFIGIIAPFCLIQSVRAIEVTQVGFITKPGSKIVRNSDDSGFLHEPVKSRSSYLDTNGSAKNERFWGIFTGEGISKKEWFNSLNDVFRTKHYTALNSWLKDNNYDKQLDPNDLVDKAKNTIPFQLESVTEYNAEDMGSRISAVHRDYKGLTENIGSSVSVSFARLHSNQFYMGAIGNNSAAIFEGVSGRGIWLPSESFYKVLHSVKNDDACISLGNLNFDVKKCAMKVMDLDNRGKYFIVLMNKAVRHCISDEDIARIYRFKSKKSEGLAQRVADCLLKKAQATYERMQVKWQKTAKEGDVLQIPECSVGVIILNEPFLNVDAEEKMKKERADIQITSSPIEIDKLMHEYSALPQNSQPKSNFDLVENSATKPLAKEKPTFLDRASKYFFNPYLWGTVLATIGGYYLYSRYIKQKFF